MEQHSIIISPMLNTFAFSGGPLSIDERDTKSRTRFVTRELPASGSREEALVVDERLRLRPAQVIERKLARLLRNSSLPVTFLLTRGTLRTR
jgi:hypothetical protein